MSRPENWISQALDVLSVLEFGFRKLGRDEIDFVIDFLQYLENLQYLPEFELEEIGYDETDLSQELQEMLPLLLCLNSGDLTNREIAFLEDYQRRLMYI